MSKRPTTCVGQTYAELEATVISMAAQWPRGVMPDGTVLSTADDAIAQMLASGFLKRCLVHPDHYIVAIDRRPLLVVDDAPKAGAR